MTRAPKRLLESGEPAEPGRRLLELGRVHAPVAYDVAAGAARFQAALSGAGISHPLNAPVPKTPIHSVKLGKLCLLLSPVVVLLGPMQPAAEPQTSNSHHAAPQISTRVPTPADRPGSPLPPEPIVPAGVGTTSLPQPPAAGGAKDSAAPATSRAAVSGTRALRRKAAKRRASARGVSADTAAVSGGAVAVAEGVAPAAGRGDSMSRVATPAPRPTDSIGELEGLARVRLLVRQEPHAAVELLERLARLHPHGYFVEEREALYVLALVEDGQRDRASPLAAAFLRQYPASPLADRVRNAVDR